MMLRAESADHNMIIFIVTINERYGGGVLSAAAKKHFKSSARAASDEAAAYRDARQVAQRTMRRALTFAPLECVVPARAATHRGGAAS